MFALIVGLFLVFLLVRAIGDWRRGRPSALIETPWLGGLVAGGAGALLPMHLSFWMTLLIATGIFYILRGARSPERRKRRRHRHRERRPALDEPVPPEAPAEPRPVPMLDDGGQLKDVWRRLRRLAPGSPNRIAAVERSCERFLKRAPAGTLDLSTIEDAQLVRDRLPSLVDACERQVEAGGDRATLVEQLLDTVETIAAAAERATARIDASGREAWDREREHVARRTARDESPF